MMHEHVHTATPETEGRVLHWAWLYDPLVRVFMMGREKQVRSQTIALAELRPGARVLEVGCGTGTLAIAAALAAPHVEVQGIDPAPEMVERARHKAETANVEARFEVGVIEKLDFGDAQFDVVLSSLMLHHLPETTRCSGIAEILRVLKPGGRLVAVDFPGPGPMLHRLGRWLSPGKSPAKRHIDHVQAEVTAAGFVDLSVGQLRPGPLFSLVARKPQ
jgi:ubiquinone/menaquinone biosynthesis C-methylase UbiE